LGVETGSSAAKKAGESRGQHEVIYIVAFHEEFLSSVGHRALCLGVLITICCGLEECIQISMSALTVPHV
jgi:hypothetical protein